MRCLLHQLSLENSKSICPWRPSCSTLGNKQAGVADSLEQFLPHTKLYLEGKVAIICSVEATLSISGTFFTTLVKPY